MFRRWMYFSLLSCLGIESLANAAEPATAIWGVFRCTADDPNSCEHLGEVEHAVEKRLQSLAISQGSLTSESTASLAACAPDQCARQLQEACPTGQGRVLGAIVQQQKTLTQIRTWLYDIGSRRIAVQDDYCQSCVLTNAVVAQASSLLEHPNFGAAVPNATPIYCQNAGASTSQPARRTNGRVAVIVIGDGKLKNNLREGIKDHLHVLGRRAVLSQVERKQLGIEELRRLLDGDRNGQVLVIEASPQGAELSLFDGTTELTEPQSVSCDGCDQRQLLDKVKTAAGALLDHCFGEGCASADTRNAPPPEACSPFPVPASVASEEAISIQSRYLLNPRLAKATKGAIWSLFAATTATTIGLAIANNFVTENISVTLNRPSGGQENYTQEVGNVLSKSAWTAAGISAAILAINIPVTIGLNRATRPPRTLRPTTHLNFQCQM